MADVLGISQALAEAEASRAPIAPLTSMYPDLTIGDAYQIQLAGVKTRVAAGRKVIGKKIGLTSKAMQDLLGVGEPDYGHLFDDMLVIEGQPCRRDSLLLPKVEGEVAFVMNRRVAGPGVNLADVLRATAGVMPALEIVDSRIRDWKIKLVDTVADNASSARFVLGSRMLPVEYLDLRLIGSCLEKNGAGDEQRRRRGGVGSPCGRRGLAGEQAGGVRGGPGGRRHRALRRLHRCGRRGPGRRGASPLRPARLGHGEVRLAGRPPWRRRSRSRSSGRATSAPTSCTRCFEAGGSRWRPWPASRSRRASAARATGASSPPSVRSIRSSRIRRSGSSSTPPAPRRTSGTPGCSRRRARSPSTSPRRRWGRTSCPP